MRRTAFRRAVARARAAAALPGFRRDDRERDKDCEGDVSHPLHECLLLTSVEDPLEHTAQPKRGPGIDAVVCGPLGICEPSEAARRLDPQRMTNKALRRRSSRNHAFERRGAKANLHAGSLEGCALAKNAPV